MISQYVSVPHILCHAIDTTVTSTDVNLGFRIRALPKSWLVQHIVQPNLSISLICHPYELPLSEYQSSCYLPIADSTDYFNAPTSE